MFDLFTKTKDVGLSLGIKKLSNYYLSKIGGEVLDIKLDSINKTIFMDIMLEGEKESFKTEVVNYAININKTNSYIEFQEIRTSREWINRSLKEYVKENRFEIPKEYAFILDKAI